LEISAIYIKIMKKRQKHKKQQGQALTFTKDVLMYPLIHHLDVICCVACGRSSLRRI
jgi:hypothetical protein